MRNLSKDQFAKIIAEHVACSSATMIAAKRVAVIEGIDEAASAIWALVAAYIVETENRIIDAEFKVTELQSAVQ